MTVLAAGASVTITLRDDGLCKVATNGGAASVTITPASGASSVVGIGPLPVRQTFGPYAEGATLTISNQTAWLDYDAPLSNLATSTPGPVGFRLAGRGRPLTIIPLGDSITQSSSTFASGLWQFGQGYAELAIWQSGSRYQLIRNAGIGGNTTAQMLSRLQADVIAYAPDVCLFMGGTNDLLAGMSNAAYASLFNNIEAIVLRLLAAGILPVIVTPPAKDAAVAETKNAQWFYYALAQYYGLPLIDMYRATVNADTGSYAAGNSSDGTHPIAAGITKMVAAATPVLSNLASAFCPPYMAAVSETVYNGFSNLIRNGAFAKVTTPPTPDAWTVNATNATPTVVAASFPDTGNVFNYNKTSAGGVYMLSGGAPSVAGGGFVAGDVLHFAAHLNVSGLSPASALGFSFGMDRDAGGFARITNSVQNGDLAFSHQFTVPAGTANLTPNFYVQDVALYKVSNWTLFNVTKANAIWQPGLQA